MYLRTTQRRNKDGSVVRYLALAENVRHPEKGYVEAKVVHSFGRADHLDRTALERLVASIQRVLADAGSGPVDTVGAGTVGVIAVIIRFLCSSCVETQFCAGRMKKARESEMWTRCRSTIHVDFCTVPTPV